MKKKPKKPTKPLVQIRISADKAVRQTLTLPDEKESQELGAITRFAELFNQHTGRQLGELTALSQDDHDFSANIDGAPVVLQLAELVDRTWIKAEPPPGPIGTLELVLGGVGYRHVDVTAYDDALRALIETKLKKHYSKPSAAFWLVIFTTASYFLEYNRDDKPVMVRALLIARNHLSAQATPVPFDQIWFTNLRVGATQVWPRPLNEPPLDER
jgi:hypothetical protein